MCSVGSSLRQIQGNLTASSALKYKVWCSQTAVIIFVSPLEGKAASLFVRSPQLGAHYPVRRSAEELSRKIPFYSYFVTYPLLPLSNNLLYSERTKNARRLQESHLPIDLIVFQTDLPVLISLRNLGSHLTLLNLEPRKGWLKGVKGAIIWF